LSYWVEKMDYFEDNYRLNALLLLNRSNKTATSK
jgi:hypothetical protein